MRLLLQWTQVKFVHSLYAIMAAIFLMFSLNPSGWSEVKLLYARNLTEIRSNTYARSAINVNKTSFEEWSDMYKKNLEFFRQYSQKGLQSQKKQFALDTPVIKRS